MGEGVHWVCSSRNKKMLSVSSIKKSLFIELNCSKITARKRVQEDRLKGKWNAPFSLWLRPQEIWKLASTRGPHPIRAEMCIACTVSKTSRPVSVTDNFVAFDLVRGSFLARVSSIFQLSLSSSLYFANLVTYIFIYFRRKVTKFLYLEAIVRWVSFLLAFALLWPLVVHLSSDR